MTASAIGYEHVRAWVKAMVPSTPATVVQSMAGAVWCVLGAQRVTAAALARALPAEQAGGGRARLTRVRRWWSGPPLEQAVGSPVLSEVARARLPAGHPVVVALDTPRLGQWAVWLAGLVVGGRTVPLGWAVMPSPWPKGRCRATPLLLLKRVQAAFPPAVRWPLGADRGFPRLARFEQRRPGKTAFSVRARLSDWVPVAGVYATVAPHLEARRLRNGQRTAATMGRERPGPP